MSEKENLNICPKCGYKRTEADNEHVSSEECPGCGIIYKKIKQVHPQQVEEPISMEDRVLCGDGCCIGIIGKNGLCTECGKSLEETSTKLVKIEEKLINCEVCEKQISINAISCPHCGEPKKQKGQIAPGQQGYNYKTIGLVNCRHCEKEVARTAEKCPYCGGISPGISNKANAIITIIVVVISIFITFTMYKSCSKVSFELEKASIELEKAGNEMKESIEKAQKSIDEWQRKDGK